ncbi:MAG: pyridoxal phosphate-dependent aminotransferase [Tenericutes bacterium]|nr:pyridoxal phosphate-dependent aminotransferase [Mycoplasmatota bacterium]
MQKYNFDETVDRIATNSIKWTVQSGEFIPLWVADMDFAVADEIKEALLKRASFGAYGYPKTPDEFYEAEILWWKKRHDTNISREWIQRVTGVIPSLSCIIKTFTKPGESVIIQTPVYNHFHIAIENNGANILKNELILENGSYVVDYENFEELAKREDTKLFILCNPHNPVGKCFTRIELEKLGDICLKHNVLVVSDEIHRDIVYTGHNYTPYLSIKEAFANNSITCTAPSKTFNLAGLKAAAMIIPNKEIFKQVQKAVEQNEVGMINVFGIEGFIAAYQYGDEWLEQLLVYLEKNIKFLIEYFKKELPLVKVHKPEATYLVWVDISAYYKEVESLQNDLFEKSRVIVNDGFNYSENSKGFLRINVATSRVILEEGLKRIVSYFKNNNL